VSKSFEIQLQGNPDEIVTKAIEAAREHGVEMTGDSQTGHFTGLGIEGSYLISEEILAVKITKKPMIMPWSMIEASLRNYFA
jgi:LDH2 family malate/lactate/ureidoglycolate dehydrogenase